MYVGYARVSTREQNLAMQLTRLQEAHCEEIFQDILSGARDDRPQLKQCVTFVRRGDTLMVTRLDRLARSTMHLCVIAAELRRKEVELVVLDQAIDTSTPTGMLIFHMLGAIAEFERALIKERQRDGILDAQKRGIRFGHTPRLTPAQVATLRQQRATGMLIKDLMQAYRLSKASVYRYLRETTAP